MPTFVLGAFQVQLDKSRRQEANQNHVLDVLGGGGCAGIA